MQAEGGLSRSPDRQAERSLINVIGPLDGQQAVRILAIFNRARISQDQVIQPAHPDAA